jgi:type VI secretion system protein ImpF
MASAAQLERLQPALLDRLRDPEASLLDEIERRRRALEAGLGADGRAALARLLADPELAVRRLDQALRPPLDRLDGDGRAALEELVGLEEQRRLEGTRAGQLSLRELRRLVLRDLEALLNTEALDALAAEEDGRTIGLLDGLERAAASILNYGIPPLAGRIHTRADCDALARGIARAIERFEPRLRAVRVVPEGLPDDPRAPATSPATFLVQGELWGYPLPEPLRLRTVLDLEEGRARIAPAAEAG